MSPIKSNSPFASYFDFFSKSGTDASDPYVAPTLGEVEFTTPGTHSWTAPVSAAHFGISIVVVGGGGGTRYRTPSSNYGAGGGGGGLRWRNAYPVTAGTSYEIKVGAGSQSAPGTVLNGGESYFISPSILYAEGGQGGKDSSVSAGGGGSPTSSPLIGGGDGGNGYDSEQSGGGAGAGGGAGGYSGNGGSKAPGGSGTNGAGGAGGGGFGGGGGVGIFGQGPNGSYGFNQGAGGSGGTDGGYYASPTAGGKGGTYGGGGGCIDNAGSFPQTNADGGGGAVRIIWGPGRQFPNTGQVITEHQHHRNY